MKAQKVMIAWTPADWPNRCYRPGSIEVGPWPDRIGWTACYALATGAFEFKWQEAPPDALALMVMIAFNTLVVRDGIPVDAAHQEFLKIDQYREHISPDMEGAA